jgi:hypothetical protein
MKTGDGRLLAPFLRSEIERMLTRHDLISRQIADVEADRKAALNNEKGVFPHELSKTSWVCAFAVPGESSFYSHQLV